MHRPFLPSVTPPEERDGPVWWFVFRGGDLLLVEGAESDASIPAPADLADLGLSPARSHFLGHLDGRASFAAELVSDAEAPAGHEFQPLRSLHGRVEDDVFDLAGRAAQILEWDRTHQFCGRCGSPAVNAPTERAKVCPSCGYMAFPRLSPAIITLVERGDEVLLARGAQFIAGRYALLAGFVEPGESLEEAVKREIREEVGVAVDQIRFFGSQPWPFPHSLMIGFFARYAGGEIEIDGKEIADAKWFRADDLPNVPPKLSIARKLIDAYAAKHGVLIDQP